MKKNIETRERKITEEIITYVAEDGKVFDNEADCKKWEESYEHTILMGMEQMPHIINDDLQWYFAYSNDSYFIYVFRPETMADITTLNAYDGLFECSKGNVEAHFTASDIGKEIILSICEYNMAEAVDESKWLYLDWMRMDRWQNKIKTLCQESIEALNKGIKAKDGE